MSDIIEFVKQHWIAYLIGAIIAIALGIAAALFVLRIGSTPDSARYLFTPVW